MPASLRAPCHDDVQPATEFLGIGQGVDDGDSRLGAGGESPRRDLDAEKRRCGPPGDLLRDPACFVQRLVGPTCGQAGSPRTARLDGAGLAACARFSGWREQAGDIGSGFVAVLRPVEAGHGQQHGDAPLQPAEGRSLSSL